MAKKKGAPKPRELLNSMALGSSEKMLRSYSFVRYADTAKNPNGIAIGSAKVSITSERLLYITEDNNGFSRREYPLESVYGVNYSYTPQTVHSKAGKIFAAIFSLLLAVATFLLLSTTGANLTEQYFNFSIDVKAFLETIKIDSAQDILAYILTGIFALIGLIFFIRALKKYADNSNFAFEITLNSEKLHSLGTGSFKRTIKEGKAAYSAGGLNDHTYLRASPQCIEMVYELGSIIQKVKNNEVIE